MQFAEFIYSRAVELAGADDIEAFLSRLATEQRSSPSTQRQALNALVFLFEKGLDKQIGELHLYRAQSKHRIPVVLSREECTLLLGAREDTSKLMGTLMRGSGTRLMNYFRLRIQDLDLDRGQPRVRGGKGDKDRVTVLPESIQPMSVKHVSRLRELWVEDREAGFPGGWR